MKVLLKELIHIIFLIIIGLPFCLLHKIFFLSSSRSFTSISEFLSLFPGYIGYFARRAFYELSIGAGSNFNVGFGTILQYPDIRISDNVYIGQNCNIAKCSIRSGVKIGSSVHIVNKNTHDFDKRGNIKPTNIKNLNRIYIGENSWIGNSSVVMANVGKNCIIGAGSVVVRPIPDNSVAVGNPAKVIRKNLY